MCIPKRRQNTTSRTGEIPVKFCSTIKTGSTHCELLTEVTVCYLRLPCLHYTVAGGIASGLCVGVQEGGVNYGELFSYALRSYGILCIGLYRFRDALSSVTNDPSAKRYVITNPPDDFLLLTSDKVCLFVLLDFSSV